MLSQNDSNRACRGRHLSSPWGRAGISNPGPRKFIARLHSAILKGTSGAASMLENSQQLQLCSGESSVVKAEVVD